MGSRCNMDEPVGIKTRDGYLRFKILGKMLHVHNVIMWMLSGEKPKQVDHLNGVRDDNREVNLRIADDVINATNRKKYRNNTLGATGVYLNKGRYEVRLKSKYRGSFSTIEEAIAFREELKLKEGFTERAGI